tara:strand:- start:2556 stop:3515 length:960 start_codon:yes stop_codon:yes gene_type:complete
LSRLYKRKGSPFWWYTWGTPPQRIQRSTGATSKKVAIRIQAKWDQELALRKAGVSVPTVDLQIPFRKYLNIVFENKKKKQAGCIKSALNMFMQYNPGLTNKHLTALALQEYFSHRKAQGKSPKTITEDHKQLSAWFEWMITMGYLIDNPTKGLIRPKLVKVRPRTAFTRDEINYALKEAWLDHDRLLWETLYKTGLRAVDGCTLTIDNINGKFVEVSQDKTSEYHEPRVVVVPLHQDLKNKDIFNIMNPASIGNSRERLKKIMGRGDLHTLRHSFASHLEEFGATRWDTKCLLGHKANDVTAQYVHTNIERLEPLINQL